MSRVPFRVSLSDSSLSVLVKSRDAKQGVAKQVCIAWVNLDIVTQSKFLGRSIVRDRFVHTAITKRFLKPALAEFKSNRWETCEAEAVLLNMQK